MNSWIKWTVVLSFLLISPLMNGQRPASSATGLCSIAITGTNNKATITCGNLTEDQAKKLVNVMNQIQKSNVDLDQLIARLNELLNYVKTKVDPNEATVIYDFNGERRTISGENLQTNSQLVVDAYQPMLRLASVGSWERLEVLAKSLISANPGWFTPQLFLGLAELNSCKTEEGVRDTDNYLERVQNYPAYQDASSDVSRWIFAAKQSAQRCRK